MAKRKKNKRYSAKAVFGRIGLVLTCLMLALAFIALAILLVDKFVSSDVIEKLMSLHVVIRKIIEPLLSHELTIYIVIAVLIALLTVLESVSIAKIRAIDRRRREERDILYIRETAKREVEEKFPSYDYLLEEIDYEWEKVRTGVEEK